SMESPRLSCREKLLHVRGGEPVPHQGDVAPRKLVAYGQRLMADVGAGVPQHRANLAELDAGTIGSTLPEAISTGTPERSGWGGSDSGTIARSNAAPASVPGRNSTRAAAMFAPLE